MFAGINFSIGDATRMNYADSTFDLVMESTMFLQIVDEELRRRIASEMARVVRPGGYVLLADWRYSDPRAPGEYKGLTQRRVRKMFPAMRRIGLIPGALVPPLGRVLSKYASPLYFMTAIIRPLVGQFTTVLQKPRGSD